MTRAQKSGTEVRLSEGVESVANYDDLSWYSNPDCDVTSCRDRRPKWLRWMLPVQYASSRPLQGMDMARIKVAAYH
jgi:hypothetical protein